MTIIQTLIGAASPAPPPPPAPVVLDSTLAIKFTPDYTLDDIVIPGGGATTSDHLVFLSGNPTENTSLPVDYTEWQNNNGFLDDSTVVAEVAFRNWKSYNNNKVSLAYSGGPSNSRPSVAMLSVRNLGALHAASSGFFNDLNPALFFSGGNAQYDNTLVIFSIHGDPNPGSVQPTPPAGFTLDPISVWDDVNACLVAWGTVNAGPLPEWSGPATTGVFRYNAIAFNPAGV